MKRALLGNPNVTCIGSGGLELIQFNNFRKYDHLISHCFTTRRGGVSAGECAELNLGFNKRDARENVMENYRRVAAFLGIKPENMVFSNQVHDCKIKRVGRCDRGKGILYPGDIIGYDGLATNEREVALVTFYADCVPVLFLDPEKKAIASAHSGWRGTMKGIAAETVSVLQDSFGSKPENLQVAIGPSIGECCFEVGEEVAAAFAEKWDWSSSYCVRTAPDKWHIHLQGIIERTLLHRGVKSENICRSNICTRCHRDLFFSYRGDGGKTGSLAAFLQLL